MPSQRLLWELDPEDLQEIACVRHEVWAVMADYKRLMKEKDVSYKKKKLQQLLDLYSKCHYLEYKTEGWSVVDWGCTCVRNLRDCVGMHSTLICMFFHKNIAVPDTLEQSLPSVCKIAGLKREWPAQSAISTSQRRRLKQGRSSSNPSVYVSSVQWYELHCLPLACVCLLCDTS